MRIQSEFNDYYDGAGWPNSPIVFERRQQDYSTEQIPEFVGEFLADSVNPTKFSRRKRPSFLTVDVDQIAFCGKWYVTFFLNGRRIWFKEDLFKEDRELIEKRFLPSRYFHQENLEKAWNHLGEPGIPDSRLIESEIVSAFVSKKNRRIIDVTINPVLRELEFQRIFDPFSAHQEIEMFLSNLPSDQPDTVEPNDSDLAKAKGFGKYSFKRPPTKEKK